jgi:formamidopyrimidine-DNA glycosylase
MPELPEVETTKRGLQKTIAGLVIKDVWTDLATKDKRQVANVANPKFFKIFKKEILNKKVLSVERRAKNILINISGGKTILAHMKMTGHFLFGDYKKDPMNRFVHFIITFSNKEKLYFSDARKFGKITLLDTKTAHDTKHLNNIGPEPLDKKFDLKKFKECLNKKPNGKVKTILMDQSVIAGIGNIYSDEILWRASVHPERKVSTLKELELKLIFKAMKETLAKGINFGGDSMSDYRNIYGLPGKFQLHHEAYRRTGEKCRKKGCKGIIKRKMINGRSAHFCSVHQK